MSLIIKDMPTFKEIELKRGPFMGLDYGQKYIGLSISDPARTLAVPKTILYSQEMKKNLQAVLSVSEEYNISALVVGWPVHMSGEKSQMCDRVENFVRILSAQVNCPIFLLDERCSSKTTWSLPDVSEKRSRKSKKPDFREDDLAATVLLQGFLDLYKS